MIKLINYQKYVSREVFISKTMIHSMQRENGMTHIVMECGCSYTAKETPEKILAMPDIEEGSKVIDWEQRRYEIAKEMLGYIYRLSWDANIDDISPSTHAEEAAKYADALIDVLKKGQDNEN